MHVKWSMSLRYWKVLKVRTVREQAEYLLASMGHARTIQQAQVYATLALADAVRDHAEVMREMLGDTNAEIGRLAEAVQRLD